MNNTAISKVLAVTLAEVMIILAVWKGTQPGHTITHACAAQHSCTHIVWPTAQKLQGQPVKTVKPIHHQK